MPVEYGQASNYAVEMRRHEALHTPFGAPGRPFVFREFPKALYRFKREPGKGIVKDEMFTVHDEQEQRNMQSRGFHETQEAAIKAIELEQLVYGTLAAERNWEEAHGRLSPRAMTEVRAAEEAHGATHLPVVPETPIPVHRKRGRKPKSAAAMEG